MIIEPEAAVFLRNVAAQEPFLAHFLVDGRVGFGLGVAFPNPGRDDARGKIAGRLAEAFVVGVVRKIHFRVVSTVGTPNFECRRSSFESTSQLIRYSTLAIRSAYG